MTGQMVNLLTSITVYLFEAFCCIMFLDIFFRRKFFNRPLFTILACILEVALFMLASYFAVNIITLISVAVLFLVIATVGYIGKLRYRIFMAVVYWTLLNGIGFITTLGLLRVLGKDMPSGQGATRLIIVLTLISKLILFVTVLSIRFYWRSKKRHIYLTRSDMLALILSPVIPAISFVMLINEYLKNGLISDATMIYALVLAVMNIFIFAFINTASQRRLAEQEKRILSQQIHYSTQEIRTMTHSHETLRKQAHDYKNQLNTIEGLIHTKNYYEARNLIREFSDMAMQCVNVISTGNAIIDALLNHKYQAATEKGIAVSFDINDLAGFSKMEPVDMVSVIGNTFDNAIEATEKSLVNRYIEVQLKWNNGQLMYSISNSIDTPISDDVFKLTSKSNENKRHGLGLMNVKSSVEKYGGHYSILCQKSHVIFVALISFY